MSKQLPKQPSLEHLKNEAKALLRLTKDGDQSAVKRVGETKLANAQLAVAREYGFASWSKLKRAVEGFSDQRDALFRAIRAGDRQRVDLLLSESPPLAHALDPNSFGASTIAAAATRNDRQMIDLLLKHGADIDARSDWWAGSFGALDFADEETSKFLLSKGARLTAHAAARLGMAAELRKIQAKQPGAVNELGGDGQRPLHFAKTPEIVDILLDAGAEIDARDLDHFGTPAQTRILDRDVLGRLVERGAATDIFMAIALDDLELVKEHLARDPEALTRRVGESGNPMIPNAPGSHIYSYNLGFVRPIQAAIKLKKDRIYDYLFQISPPAQQLVAACLKGDRPVAVQIAGENPDLVSRLSDADSRAICEAARSGLAGAVGLMLEVGFDVHTADGEKMTPVHWAAFRGDAELVRVILPYHPDLEKRNCYGGTALSTCLYGSEHGWGGGNFGECVDLLLGAGSVPPDSLRGSPEVVEVLKRHGVT